MKIITQEIRVSTKGRNDIHDITGSIQDVLSETGLQEGNVTTFVIGSTASVTTIEYEPGLLKDLPEALDKFAPMNKSYHHDNTWHDGNGYAHIRASIMGSSLVTPFSRGRLLLGTWQQIIIIDFDNRPRNRTIVIQIIGE